MPAASNAQRTTEISSAPLAAPARTSNARAPMISGRAVWRRLSSVRSEFRDTKSIAISPNRWGITTKMPIVVLERPLARGLDRLRHAEHHRVGGDNHREINRRQVPDAPMPQGLRRAHFPRAALQLAVP